MAELAGGGDMANLNRTQQARVLRARRTAKQTRRKKCAITVQLVLSLLYCVVQGTVGYYRNCLALQADAFHMLHDAIGLFIGLYGLIMSLSKSDERWFGYKSTYGWSRASTVATFASTIALMVATAMIFVSAVERFVHPEVVQQPELVFYVGFGGLFINTVGILMLLFVDSHVHAHGHSHDHGNKGIMQAVFLHLIGDLLGSVIVLITSGTMWYVDRNGLDIWWVTLMDPTLSIILGIILVVATWKVLKESTSIVLQTVPDDIDEKQMVIDIENLDEVCAVKKLHVWQLSEDEIVGTAKVDVHSMVNWQVIQSKVYSILERSKITDITVQLQMSVIG